MMDLRNLLIEYRMLHFKDPYKEIDIGLDGRDEELCKPTLELLYSLGASDETQKMAESTLQYFLDIKNKRKGETLEAMIYPIVLNIVRNEGECCCDYGNKDNPELPRHLKSVPAIDVWGDVILSLEGAQDKENPSLFYSDEFGKIYRNNITKIICDKFGAEIDHRQKGNILVFDTDYLIKTGKIYLNMGIIKTKAVGDSVTHKTQSEANTPNNSDNNGDSSPTPSPQGGISESPNHQTKEWKT